MTSSSKNNNKKFSPFPIKKKENLRNIENILQYSFAQVYLLDRALHHPSAGGRYFESLEFLGDRVLALVMSQCLLEHFPHEKEGDIAKRFVCLTRREALLEVSELWCIKLFLKQKGQIISGSRVLADGCEAIIGAVYWDMVIHQGQWSLFVQWLISWWKKTHFWKETMGFEKPVDAKSLLQEHLQSLGQDAPIYHLEKQDGPSHCPVFYIAIHLKQGIFRAFGKTKSEGEQRAAKKALEILMK